MTRLRALLFPPPEESDRDARPSHALGLSAGGVFLQGSARFGYSILIAHIAGKEALGEFNLLLALAVFLVLCWPQAAATAAARYIAMARGARDPDLQAASAHYAGQNLVVAATALAAVAVVVCVWGFGLSLPSALLVGTLVMTLSAYNFVKGVRAGNNHFATTTAWDLISVTTSLTLMLLVLLVDLPALLFAPLVLGYAIPAIAGWPRRKGALPQASRQEMRRFIAWGSVQVVAAGGLMQVTLLLASGQSTPHALGDFAAAAAIATPAGLAAIVMRTSLAPSIARMFSAGDMVGVRARVDLLMHEMVAVLLPVFAVGILLSPWIIRLLFGERFSDASLLSGLLLFGVSFSAFSASHLRLNNTEPTGVRRLASCNIAGLTVGVVTVVATSPTWGVRGAAVAFLAGSAVSSIAAMIVVWRMDQMPWLGLTIRLLFGYLLIGLGLLFIEPYANPWSALGAVGVFLVLWGVVWAKELSRFLGRRTVTS